MKVLNVHERVLATDPVRIGALIDALSSPADRLWPTHTWPRMVFDRPLGIGARGGHGPIRYFVEEYTSGQSIRFRFSGPNGFDGFHGYEIVAATGAAVLLRHALKMETRGMAWLSWPLIYRPLHDALLEDSMATAQAALGLTPRVQAWSPWVRWLRWLVSGGKARPQALPDNAP